jgi:hypothetical protein
VETELATDYAPLLKEEKVECNDGKVAYEKLSRTPAYIIGAFDEFGRKMKIRLFPTYFTVANGAYTVRYAALPTKKRIEADCEFSPSVTERVAAFGVAAEYCLQNGLYAEHAVWDKKYKSGLATICQQRGIKNLKVRSWV